MIKTLITGILLLVGIAETYGQTKVPVFVSGDDGHRSYRIPAIITAPNGDLLAIAEGRVKNAADFGDINLVMKRSSDKGKSWSPLTILIDNDSLQVGNPAPVVDMSDPRYPKGRIFLFYNTGNNHEGEVRKGNGLREVWFITSVDNGHTWSTPQNITSQVHRPNEPNVNPAYSYKEDWRHYANTPGHALQLTKGQYKGRLFVASNHSAGEPLSEGRDYAAHGFYTDDHGETFQLGERVNLPGSNECTAAELSDGTVMMNIRNQRGDIRARIIALSNSGGTVWDTVYFDMNLPDPVCQGSLLNVGSRRGKNILAFSNAADPVHRDNLTLRISYDEGKTWKKNIVIDKAPAGQEANNTAYSDLVKLSSREIGVLYESDDYSEIVFTAIRW